MCGLGGIVGAAGPGLEPVRRWGQRLAHRGPDDWGIGVLGHDALEVGRDLDRIAPGASAILWHRRLSILDLSPAGWQPMLSPDGRHAILLNGEIYNYRELRAELESMGVRFRSRSDTEVLLEAVRAFGPDVLRRLIGMFAIAILDVPARRLLLARDPFGIKPLYYAAWDGGFAFASEQKALLDLPQVSRRANPQSVYDYLRFGLTDHGAETMVEGIRACPPAHWMEVAVDSARPEALHRYWSLDLETRFGGSFEQAAERVRELFLDSVRLHLRSDVPVGAALSGGIDSSAILLAMRTLEPDAELHAFSYVADAPDLTEERWIDLAADAAHATVHKTRARPSELMADFEALVSAQDEPFGGTSIYAQHRVFRIARDTGIKVMLDGQGADELLGGYHGLVAARLASLIRQGQWIEAARFWRRASRAPGRGALGLWAGEFLLPKALQGPFRKIVGEELLPAWLDRRWFAARGVSMQPAKYAVGASSDVLREQLHRSLTRTSLPMLLRYEDRNSMAHSIESRVPFLTPALTQFALSLPEEHLIDRDGQTKAVFRRAMRGIVPDPILDRRDKIGFATPEHAWMLELRPYVEGRLNGETAARLPMLRVAGLNASWRAFCAGPAQRDFRVWRWINLIEWAERTRADFS